MPALSWVTIGLILLYSILVGIGFTLGARIVGGLLS